MSSSIEHFRLRALQPSDSTAVTGLITEFDGDMTTRFLVDPYAAITLGTENGTVGVVVEEEGRYGLVGMGTVRFYQAQFNGELLPMAVLDGLKVQPEFRGQGLGWRIAEWRVRQARERFGERGVIATGMLHENHASRGVAQKWCREFIDQAFAVWMMPVREQSPKPVSGLRGCVIEPGQFEEFAAKQNVFYREHNFYQPHDADSISRALEVDVEGRRPYRFYAVVDDRGNLIAGAQSWARGLLKSDTLNSVPPPVRVMNRFVRMIPEDGVIHDIAITGLWFAEGRADAGQYLWEWMRWAGRDQGTTLMVAFDPRDPAKEAVKLKPWHQPRPNITYAVLGPSEVDRGRLVYAGPRV